MVARWTAVLTGQACTAYTRYVLDIGQSEDLIGLLVAMLPCSLGYHDLAQELDEWDRIMKGAENPYWTWIESYRSEDYCKAVEAHKGILSEQRADATAGEHA
jgi:thiaminase